MINMSNYGMVAEFHSKFGVPIGLVPQALTYHRQKLRFSLIAEEFEEYRKAVKHGDIVKMADGLTDILYVTYGASLEHGFPMGELFKAIHESNMTKLGENGRPVYRKSDGKVIKGPAYVEPDLADVLRKAGWDGSG